MSSSYSASISPEYLAESRVSSFIAGSTIPPAIATVFVLARCYARAVILRAWSIDDTLIIFAWLCALAVAGLDFGLKANGTGRHIEINTLAKDITLLKLSYAVRLVYQFALTFTKLSICFFYLRIFSVGGGRYVCFGLIAYIIISSISIFGMMIFQCSPIKDVWSIPPGHCPVSNLAINITVGVLNIVGDVGLLIGVLPRIAKLHLPFKEKAGVMSIVATYLLVIVAAIIRVSFVAGADNNIDQTWAYVRIGLWSVIEINTGLFCVSVIAIRPLLRKLCPKRVSSYWSNTTSRRALGPEKEHSHECKDSERQHTPTHELDADQDSNGQLDTNLPLASRSPGVIEWKRAWEIEHREV